MTQTWDESDSDIFLEYGRAFTPQWKHLRAMFLRLIPAKRVEPFTCIDIGAGSGWLSEAILQEFPKARVLAFDGSPAMLGHLRDRLARYGRRLEAKHFDLLDLSWSAQLPQEVRCAVSCLAVHHLDDADKRKLFSVLYAHLTSRGALLYADLVKPESESEREEYAAAWDELVLRQSRELFGDLRAFDAFVNERWNYYRYPDPVDKPATLAQLLVWFGEAGFKDIEVFWACAGHVLIGGFKSEGALVV